MRFDRVESFLLNVIANQVFKGIYTNALHEEAQIKAKQRKNGSMSLYIVLWMHFSLFFVTAKQRVYEQRKTVWITNSSRLFYSFVHLFDTAVFFYLCFFFQHFNKLSFSLVLCFRWILHTIFFHNFIESITKCGIIDAILWQNHSNCEYVILRFLAKLLRFFFFEMNHLKWNIRL